MRNGKWGNYAKLTLLAAVIISGGASTAYATSSTSNSANYQVTETQFGIGSSAESCSGQFCAKTSIGDLGTGSSKSPKSTAAFGSLTDSEPLLEVIVDTGVSELGELTTEKTATKTMIVRIRNYLSDGYTLQITGNAPHVGGHALDTPATPTASKPGTEQFALNVAANTTPQVGAVPVQVPSDQMSFGAAVDGYNIPNMFQYVDGAVIARSNSESGRTDYTVSMIVNIANNTPAGHYSGDFSAVVIPVF